MKKKTIRICHGKKCKKFATELDTSAIEKIQKENLEDSITTESCHCLGECAKGPNIQILTDGKRITKNYMNKRAIEKEIDILSGKQASPSFRPGTAKKNLNDLLSGGF